MVMVTKMSDNACMFSLLCFMRCAHYRVLRYRLAMSFATCKLCKMLPWPQYLPNYVDHRLATYPRAFSDRAVEAQSGHRIDLDGKESARILLLSDVDARILIALYRMKRGARHLAQRFPLPRVRHRLVGIGDGQIDPGALIRDEPLPGRQADVEAAFRQGEYYAIA